MAPLLLILSVLGCSGADPAPASTPPAPAAPSPAAAPGGPAPGGAGPGGAGPGGAGTGRGGMGGAGPASAAEDLRSSWRPALAVAVSRAPAGDCPDADGDGAPDARRCGAAPETLDCDDTDPSVGPATERWIPAGPFLMGSASDHAGRDESPVHAVTLAGYCLDVHEARAADVGAWVVASGTRLTGPDLANLDAAGGVTAGKADHPATGLTWAEADAYCAARGKALPTEAQWEKAARGGCEGGTDPAACDPADLRPYPWGTAAPTCDRANHQSGGMPGPPELCVGGTLPVDALPDGVGPYGHHHLAGNAWEWVADAYHPAVYRQDGRTDPGGAAEGPWRGLRGGGWSTFATNMRAANRFQDLVMGSPTGVRCARPTVASTPDPVEPLQLVTLSGEVRPAQGTLSGRALYITAFDEADVDPRTGMLTPGRSPAAEMRLTPGGGAVQAFSLAVPAGGTYRLSAALDGGPTPGDDFVAASGSGGMGEADQNPVDAAGDVDGLTIRLQAPPAHGPAGSAGAQGPGKARGKRPGGHPPRPPGGPGR